ncbi:MAG: hypothetical protein ACLTMP_08540 [Eggerthella lenta]
MSDGSAWEREALSIKQVPSLQALLRCCDERLLVRAIVEEHAVLAGDWDALPAKRKRAAEKRWRPRWPRCGACRSTKRARGASLLLPHESFVLHARSGLIERHVSAALLSLDDVPLARRPSSAPMPRRPEKPRGRSRVPTRSIRGSGRLRAACGWAVLGAAASATSCWRRRSGR